MKPALLLLLPLLAQDPSPSASPPAPSPEPSAPAESPAAPPGPVQSPAPPAPPSPEASASPATPAGDAVRVAGRDVPWPKRTKSVTPAYPPAAQAIGQRGIVIVQLLVGVDGKVMSAEVVRSVPPFDEPALEAVRQWEYEVTRVDGQPVLVQLTLPITFALRLPNVARESGVPELRQGVAPPFPAGQAPREPARVLAELTLDPDGQVREAAITEGDPPFTEALLRAVRTWAFIPLSESVGATVTVEATFSAGKEGPRVQLRLFGLREEPRSAQAPAPAASPAAAAPPAGAGQPASRPPAASTPPAAPPPAAEAPPAPRPPIPPPDSTAEAPATEVVPGPPPAPRTDTTIMETGVSAIPDVSLSEGVPDLTSGRRPLVPPLARMEGITGQVEVRFVVEGSGATSNLEIAGPERLKEAARQTVGSWTFRRTSTERLFLVVTIEYGSETARAAVKRL